MRTADLWVAISGVGLFSFPVHLQAAPGLPVAPAAPMCAGTDAYADDFTALTPQARDFDRHPEATFSYCTRSSAVYECLSYGADGGVRRTRKRAAVHGTAFAYKHQGGDTLLLTNDHVASWPAVSDPQHPVDGIPIGCKRVSETLTLVDDESDSYARDDVPVTRVVTDPELDVAVLKAHAELQAMPWKIGHSAALRERNVVEVRGFPLGAFRATSVGKVISAHDHDDQGEWDHDDFVIDALLSAGNSGSPVLALSCATGEYELVGIYHAGYVGGSALNVVVGIDQVRDLMTTCKRTTHDAQASAAPLDRNVRAEFQASLDAARGFFFPFGGQVATVLGRPDGALLFAVFPKDFPFNAEPSVVVEDRPAVDPSNFGEPGQIWVGSSRGLKAYDAPSLDADSRAFIAKLLAAIRTDAVATAAFRHDGEREGRSRQSSDRARRTAQALLKTAASRADLVQAIAELSDRLGPAAADQGLTWAAVLLPPASSPTVLSEHPAPPTSAAGPGPGPAPGMSLR